MPVEAAQDTAAALRRPSMLVVIIFALPSPESRDAQREAPP